MFVHGLTNELADALRAIVSNIPSLLPEVQDRLLDAVSMLLAGSPFSYFVGRRHRDRISVCSSSPFIYFSSIWSGSLQELKATRK